MKHTPYLIKWSIITLSILFLVGLLNIIVDPYGFFHLIEIRGFNQQKEGVRNKIRYVKALELPLRAPGTILLGSSRVHDGLNPDHALMKKYPPVYNLGIDMLRIHEALLFLEHAIENSPPRALIFGIDFFMFNAAEKINPSFNQSFVGRKITVMDYLIPLFTITALQDSIRTIQISHMQPNRREFLPNGYRPGKYVFYYEKVDYPKLHYLTNWIFLSANPMAIPYYGIYKTNQESFSDFEKILAICKKNNIECKIFITPAHANLDGEGIKVTGLWGNYENWKRRVTELTYKYSITLFDFSGYNEITTEKVGSSMRYFWDSSHFTEKTADLILRRIYNEYKAEAVVPDNFGVMLTPQNIEDHLDQIRKMQNNYAQSHAHDVATIESIFRDANANKAFPNEWIIR